MRAKTLLEENLHDQKEGKDFLGQKGHKLQKKTWLIVLQQN